MEQICKQIHKLITEDYLDCMRLGKLDKMKFLGNILKQINKKIVFIN